MLQVSSDGRPRVSHAHVKRCLRSKRQRPVRGPPIAFDEPAPRLDPRGPLQKLVLRGEARFKAGNADVKSLSDAGLLGLEDNRFFLAAWLDSSYVSAVELHDFQFDDLEIPIRDGMSRALKLEFLCRMKDDKSSLTKTYSVDSAAGIITPLVSGGKGLGAEAEAPAIHVELKDPFMDNTVSVRLEAKNRVHVTLSESALERVSVHNEALESMGKRMVDQTADTKCRVPRDAEPFLSGMTSLSTGGIPELNTGAVKVHYGVLSDLIQHPTRILPVTSLFHYLANAAFQSGMSVQTILALPPVKLAQFAGTVISGLTLTAAGCLYESDGTPRVGVRLSGDGMPVFRLTPVMTENIGQSFSESSFLGRDKPTPVVPVSGLHACQDVPALEKLAHSAPHTPVDQGYFEDDCENSACAKKIAAESILRHPWSDHAYVKSELGQSLSTRDLKDACITAGRQIFGKIQEMLASGKLTIDLLVCLASCAQEAGTAGAEGPFESGLRALAGPESPADSELGSNVSRRPRELGSNIRQRSGEPGPAASRHVLRDEYSFSSSGSDTDVQEESEQDPLPDVPDDAGVGASEPPSSPEDLFDCEGAYGCGHCCAVLRWKDPEQSEVYVEILEGTTACKKVEVTHDTPLFNMRANWQEAGAEPQYKTMTLDKTLSNLSQFLANMSRISTCEPGVSYASSEYAQPFGWYGPQTITGYTRETIVMNHLHCLDKAPKGADELGFYRWMMYSGWCPDAESVGCMPVNETGENRTKDLRAFGADLSQGQIEESRRIFDECMPPIASKKTIHEFVTDLYKPLRSLCDINVSSEADSVPGKRYEFVAFMETMASPAFRDLALRAKATLLDEANRINMNKANSDGIEVSVSQRGDSEVGVAKVPCFHDDPHHTGPITVTYVDSLCEAAVKLKWPGVGRWYRVSQARQVENEP